MSELLAGSLPQELPERKNVAIAADYPSNGVLGAVWPEELDTAGCPDWISTHELSARWRCLDHYVQSEVAALCNGISVRRDLATFRVLDQVAIKWDGPGNSGQQHLVVACALSASTPAKDV